jgi:hypothetical protein
MIEKDKQDLLKWFRTLTPEEQHILGIIIDMVAIEILNKETTLLEELRNEMLQNESKVPEHHSLNWYGVEKRIKEGKWGK